MFVPVAFLGGLTGRMYQQFALTIAISVLLSAFNALSLSPALAAMLLKPHHAKTRRPSRQVLSALQRGFDATTGRYVNGTRLLVRRAVLTIVIVAAVAVGAGLFGSALPAGFVPDEDQGIMGINVTLPPASSLERTSAVLAKVEQIVGKTEGIESFQTIGGYGLVTTHLPAELRHALRSPEAVGRAPRPGAARAAASWRSLQKRVLAHPGRDHLPVQPPDDLGLRRRGRLQLPPPGPQRHAQRGRSSARSAAQFMEAARKRPEIGNLFTSFDPRYPQVKVELDREKARLVGVPVNEVFQAMSAVLGGTLRQRLQPLRAPVPRLRPGRFGLPPQGRRHRQDLRAQQDHEPDDPALHARHGSALRDGTEITNRFNLFRSVEINGASGARLRLGPDAGGARGGVRADDAEGDGLRLQSDVVPGEGRAAGRADVRPGDRLRVPAARGACTRAGGCRGPCCSARRWSRSAPSSASGSWATTTTSTCRSATSC